MFNVGDTVTVKTKNPIWKRRKNYAFPIKEYDVYTGVVVVPPKWAGDKLALTTGIKNFPIRLIEYSSIVDSDNKEIVIKLPSQTWSVKGSKGDAYVVTYDGSSWSCTCTGFGFRKSCKHIVEKKKELDNV